MKINVEATAHSLYRPSLPGIDIESYYLQLAKKLSGQNVQVNYHQIDFQGQTRTLTEIVSGNFDKYVIITAGFHAGTEPAPVISLLSFLPELLHYASDHNVGIVCFPLVNEQAARDGTRYGSLNPRNLPNNDAVRFNGNPKDDFPGFFKDDKPVNWDLVTNYNVALPGETKKLIELLGPRFKSEKIAGMVDMHADYASPSERYFPPKGTYSFVFGSPRKYRLVNAALADKKISVINNHYEVQGAADELVGLVGGLVNNYHDGSFLDWAFLSGVPFCVTPEVVEKTLITDAAQVYWYWATSAISTAASKSPEQWLKSANRLKIS